MGVQIRLEKNLTDAERRTLFEWGQDIFGVADKIAAFLAKVASGNITADDLTQIAKDV